METEKKVSKTWYIVIGIIVLLLIIGYGIWIWYAYDNKLWIFENYIVTPDPNSELYQPNLELYQKPLTPEEEQKKNTMIKDALARLATNETAKYIKSMFN